MFKCISLFLFETKLNGKEDQGHYNRRQRHGGRRCAARMFIATGG